MFIYFAAVGCVILVSVYVLTTYRSKESCNIIHIGVNSVYEGYESHKSHNRYFSDDLVLLKGFNENIMDEIYMDKNIRDLKLRIKDGNATYHEYVECYTIAFNNAIDKLKEKSGCSEMELDGGNLTEFLLECKFQIKHSTSDFFVKTIGNNTQQNIKDDQEFIVSFKKLLLMGFFDLLKRNEPFKVKIYFLKTKDTMISYAECKLKNRYNSVNLYRKSYLFSYSAISCDINVTEVGTVDQVKTARCFNYFYIDLTSTIMDMVCDVNTKYPKTSPHVYKEFEKYMTESVFRTLAVITELKNCKASKPGFKFIIVFDQLSVIEYARLHFFEHDDMLESILIHLNKLIQTVQIFLTKKIFARELLGIKPADVEFLDQKELIKLKVSCHAHTKQFIEKYAMPDFSEIAKKLDRIFETRDGSKTFGSDNCRIIDSLVESIFDNTYDRNRNNPKYKEAVEIIGGGCNSCKRQDTRCEVCVDFLGDFEYVYAKIVSYCLTLEDTLKLSGLE